MHLDLSGNGLNPALYIPSAVTTSYPDHGQSTHLPPGALRKEQAVALDGQAPRQLGQASHKQLLCFAGAKDCASETDVDTDRKDLSGGGKEGLRPIAGAKISGRDKADGLELGLSRHERDLAQSLNLSHKLAAPPRNMRVQL
jgi:hypothetical protein